MLKTSPLIIIAIALASATVYAFASASDSFTRADASTLGTNWIDPETEFGIISNKATQKNILANSQAVAWWNPSTNSFTGNQFSQVTCGSVSGGPYGGEQCGVIVEATGASLAAFTGYQVSVDPSGNTWGLYRQDAGPSYNSLASGSHTAVDGDVIYLEDNAGTLKLKINGSTVATVSDSTYGAGQPGLNVYSNGGVDTIGLTTWSGGDVGGGGPVFPKAIINAPVRGGGTGRRR